MEATIPSDKLGLILKLGLFAFLAFAGLVIFGPILLFGTGYLVAAAGSTFAAAAVANAISIRVFERGRLVDIGLNWHGGALRNLSIGFAAGSCTALAILLGPLALGLAFFEPAPSQPAQIGSAAFVLGILLFGSVGEEMLFRGYGFQIMLASLGRVATIIPSSLLFGWAHASNQNVSWLGLANTIGFGVVLGYAFIRSGDLWLPIGIHFGWNWIFPLFGLNLSGFTMGVTGYAMRWRVSDLWSGGEYGPEASIMTCGVILVLLIVLHRAPVRKQQQPLLARQEA